MSGNMRRAHVPSDPLELRSASPNRVLVRDLCRALSPAPCRLSCGSILLCALNPPAARALTSQACQLGSLLTSLRSTPLYGTAARRGRAPNRQVWEGTRVAADGFEAQSKIEPQASRKAWEIVLCTDP
ncbi:MAG TPA: hypothetical protein VLG49_03955 [Rhabdochlamydiaceae bacterium]|nr:hypothetical protein [Rhabdochlamydiaceae bacterium]